MQGCKQSAQDQHVNERSAQTPVPTIEMGTVLSERFLLQELLGEGGMGRVYKALDLRREEVQDPNPYVAIKLLNENIRSMAGAGIALQREAVIAQRLQHHHIASVYDYNRDERHAYIVMELIEGYTLDQLIISEYPDGLPAVQSFKIINQLIETVLFAHHKGVVHADIKPSNVKVMPNGDIKIMDFGLARVMSLMNMASHADDKEVDAQWRHRSLSDAITPSYATRARLHGRQPIRVDDTFALACVIYLILTGRHPYQRMNADKALKQGIKPERPSQLSKKQWLALQSALDPNIDKESCALNAMSSVFCTARRKTKQQKRKWISAAALLLLCGVVIPVKGWFTEQLPVWQIRFMDADKQVEHITRYMADDARAKQQALQDIYIPVLVERWGRQWATHEPLLTKPAAEQTLIANMLQQDLLVANVVAPYFLAHKQFVQSRYDLQQARSKIIIEILVSYDDLLGSHLTASQPMLASDFMSVYNHATLLDLIAGSSALIKDDPRLNQLLRDAMNEDWTAGRYLPLGEKLQVAKALMPENEDFKNAMVRLSNLMSSESADPIEPLKNPLFLNDNLLDEDAKRLIHPPILQQLFKELKVATSNQLDLNPVYRDYLTEVYDRFVEQGGDVYQWKQWLIKADLDYGRSLANWGQSEEAFQVLEGVLTTQFRF